MRMLRAAALGAVAGLVWGVVARGFMRLLTESPEFTWSGTLAIVGSSTLVGAMVLVVREQRLAGRSPWWRLLGLPFVLLLTGAGILMLPGATGVALLADRRRWLRPVGLGLVGLTGWAVLQDLEGWPSARQEAGVVVLLGCLVVQGLALRELVRRWRPRVHAPRSGSTPPARPEPAAVEARAAGPVELRRGVTSAP